MNGFSILCFLVIIFKLQLCYSKSSYVFTQSNGNTFVCNINEPFCQDAIFIERDQKNLAMNLGFLNSPSEIFYNGYNMTEFGFPIFYEYVFDDSKLKVSLIIANGKKTTIGNGKYFYVTLFDEDGKCGETRPTIPKDTVSAALYLNQKFAKYAYFLYQSSSTTCMLSIKFEDLLQGNYGTAKPILIKPEHGLIIQSQVKDFIYPFFTIDSIFGTMVYLIKNESELAAIHYKIDENDLTNFEKVFSIPLPVVPTQEFKKDKFYEAIFHNSLFNFVESRYPSFTSYGKSTFLFFAFKETDGLRGVWSPKKQPASSMDKLRNDDSLRYLYFLDSDYFENGEPVGKFIPTVILTPSSASESLESLIKCPEETSYLGAFIAFAVIDLLLMLALLGLGFLIWFGSKKMKKLRHLQNQRRGKKESSVYGVTSATTVAPTAQPSAVQPSAAVGGGASVAPTDLNTQITTTKKVTTYENAKNGKTTVTKQQQTTQVTAAAATTGKKATVLQTWK